VATQLRCGGENNGFIANSLLNTKVIFFKSVNIWQSCERIILLVFFYSQCRMVEGCEIISSVVIVHYVFNWQCIYKCSVCCVLIYIFSGLTDFCSSSNEVDVLTGWCCNVEVLLLRS